MDRTGTPKKQKWDLSRDIASWSSNFKIKADATTALLKVLRQYDFPDLESDSRSLMNTPRDTAKLIRSVEPGHYIHIGIAEGVQFTLKQNNVDTSKLEVIVIDYDTDGVQMTDSTDNVFWPIWCRLQIPRVGRPFLVGNYYSSTGQPRDFNCFTSDFVSEFKKLMHQGLKIGYNKVVTIRPGRFLGDAPGRCDILGQCFSYVSHSIYSMNRRMFLSGIKHPSGYYGCGRCTVIGVYKNHRVCFPNLDAPLRTDESFQDRSQPQHHHFKSLVEQQLGLRCITQSPLDGMHLVYGCSVRRLLFWYNEDTVNYKLRLSSAQIDEVNKMLNIAVLTKPMEFARAVKDVRKFKKFKCTQLRQFLLYLSIVVMKKVLSKFQYEHLLLFVIGIRILSHEKHFKEKNNIAKRMLYDYVDILGKNFGQFRLIYSTHNLIHLADECLAQNEPLDAFAMWDFETANSSLKEFTKRQGAYLEQSYNRTMEKYHSRFDPSLKLIKFPILKFKIEDEYDDDYNVTKTFYSRVEYDKFTLDVSSGNGWFLTKSGCVGLLHKAFLVDDLMKIQCQVFKQKFDFFDNPLKSTFLHIVQCYKKDLSNYTELNVDQIESKMFMIEYDDSYILIPLL